MFKTSIDLKGGNFNSDERSLAKLRLYAQLDDSAKVVINDFLFAFHFVYKPAAYDTAYTFLSARNIIGSMHHLGYYQAKDSVVIDTTKHTELKSNWFKFRLEKQKRVTVKYIVTAGNPTLIDTVSYNIRKPDLQKLADSTKKESLLVEKTPVSKANVLGDLSRMVDLYRNNGYYKFSADDLKVTGDTSILSLTTVSDDPFQNILLLAEANEKRNMPTIKLSMILNPLGDSLRLQKFRINKVYIYPDYNNTDTIGDKNHLQDTTKMTGYVINYHKKLFSNSFLSRNMDFKKGDLFKQESYAKTISNFSKTGVWQNVNIQTVESKDSIGKLDMIVQMIPAKKYGFEANVEASYSANSSTNSATVASAGNLFGLSTNFSLQNRNIHQEGIKMTHAIRAGVELNTKTLQANRIINSNELSYTNTITFPRLLGPINLLPKSWFNKGKLVTQQSFINFNPS
ncbi:MAG: hypothetical protein H7334_09565, partial [Ferruginibacter sp.]|nr:hypothetical protein [Ferruginibacter sp.]